MTAKVKEIDELRDSVRREREGLISIVENLVKKTFDHQYGNGRVGIKVFGSMATDLAIETSDVDIVVTGIIAQKQTNQKDHCLKMIKILNTELKSLYDKDDIVEDLKLISTAKVPIIKLVADLQGVSNQQDFKIFQTKLDDVRKEKLERGLPFDKKQYNFGSFGIQGKIIQDKMRYLKVDISIGENQHDYQ